MKTKISGIRYFTLHITPQSIKNLLLDLRVNGTIKTGHLKQNSINRPFVITIWTRITTEQRSAILELIMYRSKKLLNIDNNAKTIKGQKLKVKTAILIPGASQ